MLRILAGGRLPPLREIWENRRKSGRFLRRKTALRVHWQTNYRAEKICNQSNILSDKPRARTKNPFTGFIYYAEQTKTLQTENISVHKGSFYYNVKMIKRSFCFHFVGAAICRPPKTQSVFPLYTAHCAVTIAAKLRS